MSFLTKEGLAYFWNHIIARLNGKAEKSDLAGLATESYVDTKVASMVDSAPETLDTLNELAAALGDDPNFATTVANQIGNKVDKVDGKGLSTNDFTNEEKEKLASIDLSKYATIEYVDEQINTHEHNLASEEDINNIINNLFN